MTAADWIAVATIAAPLIVQMISTWQANAAATHNVKLQRVVGMAGREAATIARVLTTQPAGMSTSALEQSLISGSVQNVLAEMGASASSIGGSADKVTAILIGELNKVLTSGTLPPVPMPKAPNGTTEKGP